MAKRVLITGSSSGIGLEAVRYFQARGWMVAATMRRPQDHPELSSLPQVRCLRLDVTDPASIRSAVHEAWQAFGGLDVVVNNAGYPLVGPLEAIGEQQLRRQLETNILGLIEVCRTLIPRFREQGGGAIVNVASMGGRLAFPFYSVYHASKWAVEGFTESLQHELAAFGIRVRIVEPGPIQTSFYDRSMDLAERDVDEAYAGHLDTAMARMNAFGKNGAPPRVVAKVIYQAATSASRRLRYPVGTMGLLLLRRLLPDALFNGLIRAAVMRRPG